MSNRFGSGFPLSALCAAVAIVAAAPVMAQNTTAAIGGRVVAADGKPVAGATVTILHRQSGSSTTQVTDAEGRYNARGLRVGGPYTVTVNKDSDRNVRDDVYLQLAESTNVDLTLGANQLSAVVVQGTATGNSKFNDANMGSGTQLGRQELESFASIQRSLQDYARLDPRLSQTDKERGEISAAGQNSRFNSITIDGVSINDTFGLESNNLPMRKQPISIDAIEAVQINLSNYDTTQKGYTGANINAITKSGTNEFKGSVYYVYRDANMAGDRYSRSTGLYSAPPASKEDTKGFTLGGPIIKDKLFFFASYEEMKSSLTAPNFGPMGSAQTNVGITMEQINAAQAAAKTYGIDIGGIDVPSNVFLSAKDTLLKLDWNISEAHRFNIRYAKSEESEPQFTTFNNSTLSMSSRFYSQNKTLETVVGQLFSDWTENFSTELKISSRDYKSAPKNNSDMPQVSLVWTTPSPIGNASTNRTLIFGTEVSRHFNNLATKTLNGYFAGTYFLGDHEIKFGLDYEKNDIFNAFVQNTKGVYEYRGDDPVAMWLAGTPTTYTLTLPLAGKTLADGAADWTLNTLGVFLQDTWKVNSALNLTGGIRIDRIDTPDSPLANPAASSVFGVNNTNVLKGTKLVQPRVGFNYKLNLFEKKNSQLRGGVGLFQGAAMNVWLTNPFQGTGMALGNFSCSGTGGSACPTSLKYSSDPNAQPNVAGSPPTAKVDFIDPDVRQPSVWKANLAFDTELPWYGLTFGVDWLHTKTKDGIYYKSLNLGAPTGKAPDGRDLFWNAAGLSPNCWIAGSTSVTSGCGSLVQANANRAYVTEPVSHITSVARTTKGSGNTVTLSLSQQFSPALGWNFAYTRTSATEVSPLTSSTAHSNFRGRAIYNPNEDVAADSAYLIRDRVSAGVNFSKAFFGKYKTTFGAFYEGRDGKPYSWTFGSDFNGDGIAGNDLLYVPKAPGSGEVLFRMQGAANTVANSSADAEAMFWSIVDGDPGLRKYKGSVVPRNSSRSKFTNSIDLRLSQEVPGFFAGNKGVISLDILNFGNLVNRRWGRVDEITFTSNGGNRRAFVNYAGTDPATGKPIYAVGTPFDFVTKNSKGESAWAMQVTARYEF
ncbi:MAG: TonB-dependent receptor [Roseateles sp.]|uniref:TonB-dependent receptor n=1 Tax=Roseateles sp. TaxID=1971397 RepID=UPI0039E99B92